MLRGDYTSEEVQGDQSYALYEKKRMTEDELE